VAGPAAVVRGEWALMDRAHGLFEPGSAPVGAQVSAAMVAPGTKRRPVMRRAHLNGRTSVDPAGRCFMAQPHPRLVREPRPQVAGDLLRAPPLTQQCADELSQLPIGVQPPCAGAGTADHGTPVAVEGSVAAALTCVASQLARDRRRSATDTPGDRPDAQAALTQVADLDALILGKETCADLRDGQGSRGGTNPTTRALRYTLSPRDSFTPQLRDTLSSRAAAATLQPRARSSMNFCRFAD